MNNSSFLLEHGNSYAKTTNGKLKINKREKHDEIGQVLESLRRIKSLSPCGSMLEIGNGVEEEHISCDGKRRTSKMMGRTASWWATFGISLCSSSLKYSKPVLQAQQPHPLWLSIIAMLSFILFASAVTVMVLVGARFTHMQMIVMLIAFFTLVLA
ncbi:uncharacterized protein LOC114165051 [Vigna unguiculata]|uniref:uncharacterized protein LOC114165051 n=1 Tax=Vigna unguiculata TaxID=3917 RepID=UPI001016EF87|nr:uncharacterized protein LOC114165051 [Vigna unguiculata]